MELGLDACSTNWRWRPKIPDMVRYDRETGVSDNRRSLPAAAAAADGGADNKSSNRSIAPASESVPPPLFPPFASGTASDACPSVPAPDGGMAPGVGGATAWTGRGVGAPVAVKGGCSLAVGIEGGCVGPGVGTGGSLRVEIKYDALMRRMVAVS